jgi:hypothetical protein
MREVYQAHPAVSTIPEYVASNAYVRRVAATDAAVSVVPVPPGYRSDQTVH